MCPTIPTFNQSNIVSATNDNLSVLTPTNTSFIGKQFESNQYVTDTHPNNWTLNDDNHSFARFQSMNDNTTLNENNYSFPENNLNQNNVYRYPTFNTLPLPFIANIQSNNDSQASAVEGNMSEIQHLRKQNEILMQRVADQQRQIEFLASQFQKNTTRQYVPFSVCTQGATPLKRRRLNSSIMMPPAA